MNFLRYSAVLFIFLLGVVLRLYTYPVVNTGTAIHFPDEDPYYHMVRITAGISDFPNLPYFDENMNYPTGSAIVWPPGFDIALALAGIVSGLDPVHDYYRLAWFLSFFPAVFGAMTVFPIFFASREIFGAKPIAVGKLEAGDAAGLLSGLLYIFIPAAIFKARYAFIDQHSLTVLCLAVMLWSYARLYNKTSLAGSGHSVFLSALFPAIAITAGNYVWQGFIVLVGTLDIFLLLSILRSPDNKTFSSSAGVSHLVAVVLLSPVAFKTVAASGLPFTPVMTSYFHLFLLLLFAVTAFLAPSVIGLYKTRKQLISVFMFLLVIVAGAATYFAPSAFITSGFAEAKGWFFKEDPFMATVGESKPLFESAGATDYFQPIRELTVLYYLFIPLVILETIRRRREWQYFLPATAGIILFLLATMQSRFADQFAPLLAIVTGGFITGVVGRFEDKKAWFAVLVSIPILAAAYSTAGKYPGELITGFTSPATLTNSAEISPFQAPGKIHDALAKFAGNHPAPGGVIAPWDIGHKIRYLTGLPVVTNNFGLYAGRDSYADAARFFITRNESEAILILDARKIRYAIVTGKIAAFQSMCLALGQDPGIYAQVSFMPGGVTVERDLPAFLDTLWYRLSRLNGSDAEIKIGSTEISVPPLEHFRRLQSDRYDLGQREFITIFEYVRGANLTITGGTPGETATISYMFTGDNSEPVVYTRKGVFDDSGRIAMRVPYSSELASFGQTSKYLVTTTGGVIESIFVPELAVRNGESVEAALTR